MEENIIQKEKKTGTWKNVLIVILLLAVLGLGGYICYDKLIKEEPKQEQKESEKDEKQEEEKEPEKEEKKEQITDVDVEKANEKLNSFNTALHFALDFEKVGDQLQETKWYLPKNIKYNTELLSNNTKKIDFVFGSAVLTQIDGIKYDVDETGEEVTGAHGIPFNTLANFYKNLLGEELAKASKYASNEYDYKVVKDVVYGSFWSGYNSIGTILKYQSLEKVNDEYTLLIDVLAYDEEGYEDVIKYKEFDKKDYPADLVSYKLKAKLTKATEEIYTIKSIQIIKK